MKKLIMGMALGAALILTVACTGNSSVPPGYEPTYQACVEDALDPVDGNGWTDAYASRYCKCLVNGLAEVWTVEKINMIFSEDYEANFADAGVAIDIGYECLLP